MLKLLRWLDDNILKLVCVGYIFLIPLYPKLPLQMVNYTYIAIRVEDFYVTATALIFLIQFLRKKVSLNWKLVLPFAIFWTAVFLSFIWGYFIQKTIIIKHLGLLNSLRRVEYMGMFFVFLSSIRSKKDFLFYLKLVFFVMFIVGVYGIGQKFLGWPAVQTMNPEYAKGYLLVLDATARISSTFGGHYDLAAYLVFMIPLVLAAFFYFKVKWWYFLIFFVSLFSLVLTASRISYGAYIVSALLFLLVMRKFKMFFVVGVLTAILTLTSGNLTSRLTRTFQQKQVFINEKTGQTTIPRKLDPNELPVGDYIADQSQANTITSADLNTKDAKQALSQIRQEIRDNAVKSGKKLTQAEEDKLVEQAFQNMKVVTALVPDISFSTRLQVEWPRALKAFLKNPLLGKGPSSITEATDNDYLRWLGEFGLFGTVSFFAILFIIVKKLWQGARQKSDESILYYGFLFGLFGFMINATYIDVFEASKDAFHVWMMAGLFMGLMLLPKMQPVKKTAASPVKKGKK